jgi:tetratricopeptide (TPR) repeat protein
MAQSVENTPMPGGLSAAESEQFRAVLAQQSAPLKKRADSTFELCASRATTLEVFTSGALGCRIRAESAPAPLPAAAGGRGSNPDEALKKLESQPSAAGFEALGQAYLEGRQLSLAQLAYSRAIELEDSRAAAHNGLGFALWLQGDAMAAKASFRKALEVDPSYDKARANLSALRCRFGDKEGAQRELSGMKDSSVSGADVDSEWRACK